MKLTFKVQPSASSGTAQSVKSDQGAGSSSTAVSSPKLTFALPDADVLGADFELMMAYWTHLNKCSSAQLRTFSV